MRARAREQRKAIAILWKMIRIFGKHEGEGPMNALAKRTLARRPTIIDPNWTNDEDSGAANALCDILVSVREKRAYRECRAC